MSNDYSSFLANDSFAIFLFHGVITERRHKVRNYTTKHLSLERFVSIVGDLCSKGVAVSIPDIVEATTLGRPLPEGAFAITFDDGFANNYSIAAPVLEEKRIPAMFYVTTGFIEANAPSWIDMIEYAVERTDTLRLMLPFAGAHEAYATREQKIQLLDAIRRYVKNDPRIEPYEFARDIWLQLGVETFEPDPDLDQKMSWAQVRELSRNRLFTVGGHGHTHRILEYLEQSELEREIVASLEGLHTHLDVPIAHYSYPEGLANCYSDRVIEALRRRGVVCSPTAEHGVNRVGDDLFRLKRIMVT